MKFSAKNILYFALGLLVCISLLVASRVLVFNEHEDYSSLGTNPGTALPTEVITVSDRVLGASTQYIGAVEGNIDFNPDDLRDLGLNTYRIYGGMSRWESEDDDGEYGWPSIETIKANPDIINWSAWDKAMTRPPRGSDYWWSGSDGEVWAGNAVTIFTTLKEMGVRPVLTIRNVDNSHNPKWAQRLNPPATEADWNEWWEHVFATVYWLNVRNDFQVDEFEIHNEPDNPDQGWRGSVEDYYKLVRVSKDAIDYVYRTYLPDRQYFIHAPVSLGESRWPLKTLRNIPDLFDSLNVHDYANDISIYLKKVRGWTQGGTHAKSPLWVGEWGSHTNDYEDYDFALNLIKNMIRASQPSSSHAFGTHIFSLYDWGTQGKHRGLIGSGGERRLSYYAFRLGTRALQGGRAVLDIQPAQGSSAIIVTRSQAGELFMLLINDDRTDRTIDLDVSARLTSGQATQWEFSRERLDEQTNQISIENGYMQVLVPSQSAILVEMVPS